MNPEGEDQEQEGTSQEENEGGIVGGGQPVKDRDPK